MTCPTVEGFEPGRRIAVPISISGNVTEYFLPHPLADVTVDTTASPAVSAPNATLVAPWLLDAARHAVERIDTFVVDRSVERAFVTLSQSAVDADRLRTAHAAMMSRSQPSRYRDAIAWVDGRSPQHAKLVPPPSSAIAPLMSDLAAFLARVDIPAWIKQAFAYYQFIHIHPFADGNGRLSRLLVAAIGAQRTRSMMVALALTVHRKAFTRHFEAMQSGVSRAYLARWQRLGEWAEDAAADVAARERELRAGLSALVGANSAGRLFDLFASGVALSAYDMATALRWSAKNAPLYVERLRESGWIDALNGAFIARPLREAQRDLVERIGRCSEPMLV